MLISEEESVEGTGSTIRLERKRRPLVPYLFDLFYPLAVVAICYALATYFGLIR